MRHPRLQSYTPEKVAGMSNYESASGKDSNQNEDSDLDPPPLPGDTDSQSSNTSVCTDTRLSHDVRTQSSEGAPTTPATPDEVKSPVSEHAVSADPPTPFDTKPASPDDSPSGVTSTPKYVHSSSSGDLEHQKEIELTPWLTWYLQKDVEWRKRLQEQCESRRRRRLEREMSAQLKVKQKAEAERVFRSWCKMKAEERGDAALEQQRRQEELEADKLRKKQRLRELSEQKYREWLETKRERESRKPEEKTDDGGNEFLEKTIATQRAFASWLKGKKGSKCAAGTFSVKCIDGYLVGFWE